MRVVLGLGLLAVALLSAWWALAAHLTPREANARLNANPALTGEMGRIHGFPLRFETEIRGLTWQSARGGLGWQADPLRLEASSLTPWQLRAQFPPEQVVELNGQPLPLHSRAMEGTITLSRGITLAAADLSLSGARLATVPGEVTLDTLSADLRQIDGPHHALDLDAKALALPRSLLDLIDPEQHLPATLDRLKASARLGFDAPIDPRRPASRLEEVHIEGLQADWGPLSIGLSGEVSRDAQGLLDGGLQLLLSDWQVLHRMLVATGLLAPDMAMMAGMVLASQAAPGTSEVTLTLTLARSMVSIGPLPLAQLPPL